LLLLHHWGGFIFLHMELSKLAEAAGSVGAWKNWSVQSACAARVALQMGCMANVAATMNTVISLSFFFFGPYFPQTST
jgi:hypothetical protein